MFNDELQRESDYECGRSGPIVIARWQSRGNKYWIELTKNGDGTFSYKGDGCGGFLGNISQTEAILACERQVSYWPSKGYRT